MSERVLVTVHAELTVAASSILAELCAHLIRSDEEPVVNCREVGDPADGPPSFEFFVRSA